MAEAAEHDLPPDLEAIRRELEEIDHELLTSFRRRVELSRLVAKAKVAAAFPFRDQLREEQLLTRVRTIAAELDLDPHQTERIFRLLIEMSIAAQQGFIRDLDQAPLRVAYQGVEGSFSHLTAQRQYAGRAGGVVLQGYELFREAAEGVRNGLHDIALLPIENSTAGSINETYDLLTEGGLVITAEVISQVAHCLLALPGTRIEDLRLVLSHPQALRQCEQFFHDHDWLRPQPEFDTAGAAARVREGNDRTVGAIASEPAARVFGLDILAHGIQNQAGNFTRFVEVAREAAPCPPDLPCKTSLLLATGHRPGDLGDVLRSFSRRGLNLAKLESRPIPATPWRYRFYLDIEGHVASVQVTEALEAIEPKTAELRILGCYPRAEVPGRPGEDGGVPPATSDSDPEPRATGDH